HRRRARAAHALRPGLRPPPAGARARLRLRRDRDDLREDRAALEFASVGRQQLPQPRADPAGGARHPVKHLSVALVLLAWPATLLAHGGSYVAPPLDGGGGSGSHPGAPFKPPSDSGGSPLSPGALSSGAHAGSSPTRDAPTAGATSSGTTHGVQASARGLHSSGPAIDVASAGWQYWWELNKDRYLDRKSRTDRLSSQGRVVGHLTGRGRTADPDLFIRPSPALVRGEVLPLLLRLLDEEHDPDILDSCMLALARSSGEDTAQFVVDALLPFLAHKDRVVRGAAALSLGVLRSPRALPALTAVMRDTGQGRRLARATGPLDTSLRACAALGLGLIDEPDSVDALCRLIEQTPDTDADLKACAVAALGSMDNQAGPQALTFLLGLLEDRRLDPPIRSHVPPAIGKLCQRMGLSDPAVEAALLRV